MGLLSDLRTVFSGIGHKVIPCILNGFLQCFGRALRSVIFYGSGRRGIIYACRTYARLVVQGLVYPCGACLPVRRKPRNSSLIRERSVYLRLIGSSIQFLFLFSDAKLASLSEIPLYNCGYNLYRMLETNAFSANPFLLCRPIRFMFSVPRTYGFGSETVCFWFGNRTFLVPKT